MLNTQTVFRSCVEVNRSSWTGRKRDNWGRNGGGNNGRNNGGQTPNETMGVRLRINHQKR